MKQGAMWGVTVVVAATALAVVLSAKEPSKSPKPSTSAAPSTAAATPAMADRIVFTFDHEDEMRQFATVWQQRQLSLTRLAVLQSYVAQENAETAKLNEQLETTYHLQLDKHYTLDTDRRVLIERWQAPDAPAAAPAPDAAAKP